MKKISVSISVILAVITVVVILSNHVTFVTPTSTETPAAAPADSSLLWTDFSHMDTTDYLDLWLNPKDGFVRFIANITYHPNGMVAMSVWSRKFDVDCSPKKERCLIVQELFYYSENGYEIAHDFRLLDYKQFISGIFIPKGGTLWDCTVSKGKTKNPSACPEPSPETHVFNHQVKDK